MITRKKMHDTKKLFPHFDFVTFLIYLMFILTAFIQVYIGIWYLYVTEKKDTQKTRIDCANRSFKLSNDKTNHKSHIF